MPPQQHERQSLQYCAIHCINNLLQLAQGEKLTKRVFDQAAVKLAIGAALRSPTQIFAIVRESPDAGRFLHAVGTGVRSGAGALPEPVQALLSTVAKSTEVGKTFTELDKYAKKK